MISLFSLLIFSFLTLAYNFFTYCRKRAETEKKKKLKEIKKEAAKRHADMLQGAKRKSEVVSKVAKRKKSIQVNIKIPKQIEEIPSDTVKNTVLKNKENEVFSLQSHSQKNEETDQNESGRLWCTAACQHPDVHNQFTQTPWHLGYENNCSVRNHNTTSSQTDKTFGRPNYTQRSATYPPQQKTLPVNRQNYHCNVKDNDFTRDHLPQNGVLIFEQMESPRSSGLRQKGSIVVETASENNTAPIQDPSAGVGTMLRRIRRMLGVREPCRADLEARRQRSKNTTSNTATSVRSSQVRSPAPTFQFGFRTTNEALAGPKQSTLKMTQEVTKQFEQDSLLVGESRRASYNKRKDSQVSHESQALHRQNPDLTVTASSDQNMIITHKVRVAHKASRSFLNFSQAQGKQSWHEMYQEMKKKKLDRIRGTR